MSYQTLCSLNMPCGMLLVAQAGPDLPPGFPYLQFGIMTSPGSQGLPIFTISSPEENTLSNRGHNPAMSDTSHLSLSRRSSETQYEFIMQTGDDNSKAMKQKLKTVRSHVMKNYLHQQQQRQSVGETTGPGTSKERRKSKQRARQSRSSSVDAGPSSFQVPSAEIAHPMPEGDLSRSCFLFLDPLFEVDGSILLNTDNTQLAAMHNTSHATFEVASSLARQYINCLLLDIRLKSSQPSYDTLRLKGETVGVVRDTLAICGSVIPPSVIFAVSLLACGCGMAGEWDEAQGHMEALRSLVESCGGIQTIEFELQRTVTWITYCLAAIFGSPPTFSPPLYLECGALSLAFFDDAQIRAWRTVKRFPKNNPFVYDVVIRLHRLGLATSPEWINNVDHRTLSNLYLEAMYEALSVSKEEPWTAALLKTSLEQEMQLMFKVWAAGLPLFVWATTRHVKSRHRPPIQWLRKDLIFSRIRGLLEGPGDSSNLPRGKSLEPILVSVFYCVEACDPDDLLWRPWAMQLVHRLSGMLKLKTHEDFKKALEFFPMTEEYRLAADHIWWELFRGSGAESSLA